MIGSRFCLIFEILNHTNSVKKLRNCFTSVFSFGMTELPMFFFRFCVVIQTREALNEAYIKHGRDFSNRPLMYLNHLMNPRMLGRFNEIPSNLSYDFSYFSLYHFKNLAFSVQNETNEFVGRTYESE